MWGKLVEGGLRKRALQRYTGGQIGIPWATHCLSLLQACDRAKNPTCLCRFSLLCVPQTCSTRQGMFPFCQMYGFKSLFSCFCSSRQFGAVGSRLTGAGWGGCTVSMVPEDKLEGFLAQVEDAYYGNNNQRLTWEENSLFATSPGGGAMGFFEA